MFFIWFLFESVSYSFFFYFDFLFFFLVSLAQKSTIFSDFIFDFDSNSQVNYTNVWYSSDSSFFYGVTLSSLNIYMKIEEETQQHKMEHEIIADGTHWDLLQEVKQKHGKQNKYSHINLICIYCLLLVPYTHIRTLVKIIHKQLLIMVVFFFSFLLKWCPISQHLNQLIECIQLR